MGKVGWEIYEFEHSTEDMSDDEEAPSRSHEDKLDRAGIWQDSSSPPRRLVFSPSATQVSCPRPSILARLGDPPDIIDRLSIVLNELPPVSTPTSVPEDSLGLSGYDSNSNVGSPDLMVEPTAEPATSVPMEPEQEEPTAEPATPVSLGSPDSALEPEAEFAKVLMESYIDHRTSAAVPPEG
jgi:hypothetical protein